MKTSSRLFLGVIVVVGVFASGAYAQRGRNPRGGNVTAPPPTVGDGMNRLITIPVVEACAMASRMRVWMLQPPAGNNGYGLGSLGSGIRIWALLPSCREANPDDPRDPCAIGRVAIEAIGGGNVAMGEPQTVTNSPNARRVQSFVIPQGVQHVRLRLLRRDDTVRWEAAVDVAGLGNLPVPQGTPSGNGFNFDFTQYPAL